MAGVRRVVWCENCVFSFSHSKSLTKNQKTPTQNKNTKQNRITKNTAKTHHKKTNPVTPCYENPLVEWCRLIPWCYQNTHTQKKNNNATISRTAGTSCKILKKLNNRVFIQFPSKVIGILPENNLATKGVCKKLLIKKLKKAGDSRYLGWISKVWGIAMNPVDHPHGGWTNGGCHPWTPTGFLTKGVKTRKKNSWSNSIIFSLRK